MTDEARRPIARMAWWAATIAWMAVIFWLSGLRGSQVPGRFGSLGHFLGYLVLGILGYMSLRSGRSRGAALALALLLCSAYGVSDEFHQSFVPGRTPDVVDWGVDTLGAAVGAALALLMTKWAARRRPT